MLEQEIKLKITQLDHLVLAVQDCETTCAQWALKSSKAQWSEPVR